MVVVVFPRDERQERKGGVSCFGQDLGDPGNKGAWRLLEQAKDDSL